MRVQLHIFAFIIAWIYMSKVLGAYTGWKGGVFVPTKISYRHQTVFANKHIWKTSVPTKNILKTWNSPCQPENFKNFKKPVPTKNSPKTPVHGDQNIIKNIKQYMLRITFINLILQYLLLQHKLQRKCWYSNENWCRGTFLSIADILLLSTLVWTS